MNNEEKILAILEQMQGDISELRTGQARLEDGQAKLEAGQAKLEAGQAKLEAGQVKLEERQAKLEDRQAKLEDGQAKLEDRQAKLEDRQAKLENEVSGLRDDAQINSKILIKLENDYGDKLTALFDITTLHSEKLVSIEGKIDQIDKRLDVMSAVQTVHNIQLKKLSE